MPAVAWANAAGVTLSAGLMLTMKAGFDVAVALSVSVAVTLIVAVPAVKFTPLLALEIVIELPPAKPELGEITKSGGSVPPTL